MKTIYKLLSLSLFLVLITSCKSEKSLQAYLVDTSGKEGFVTGDFPVSSLLTADSEIPIEAKETMESIKKVNIAYLAKTADNQEQYEAEKEKLSYIFKDNKDYKSLMSMKWQGMNVKVFYSGEPDAIDEVVALGYSSEAGVGVARLLGDNMDPSKVIKMMNYLQKDTNVDALKSFAGIFKD